MLVPRATCAQPAPLLTACVVVCREILPELLLPHVVQCINECIAFKTPECQDIPCVCELNCLALLYRLDLRAFSSAVDQNYKEFLFETGLVYAVQNDNLEMAEWLYAFCPASGDATNAVMEAAALGNVPILDWLASNRVEIQWSEKMLSVAARNGRLAALQRFHRHPNMPKLTYLTAWHSVANGHLDTAMKLFSVAVENGQLGAAKLLVEQGCCSPLRSVCTVNRAVWNGDLEMVKWACALPLDPSSLSVTEIPASCSMCCCSLICCCCGHFRSSQEHAYGGIEEWLERLKLVRCLGLGYSSKLAMKIVAQCEHLNIVQWLHEDRGHAYTVDAMKVAAAEGHLPVLEYLYSRWRDWFGLLSLKFPDAMLEKAAAGGRLEVVKWLREKQPDQCLIEARDKAVHRH